MNARARLSAVLSFVLLAGCAPRARTLVERHHAREALCALESLDEEDSRLVRDALWRDLAPRAQVSRIDVGQPDLHAVAVRVATDAIPVDELRLRASPIDKESGIASWDLHSLATMLGEKLPSSRTVSPSAGEGATIYLVRIMTFGILRLDPSPTRTEYPSEGELRRAAPRAFELSRMLDSECTRPESEGVAARCTFVFAVRDEAPPPRVVDLRIELMARGNGRETCRMSRTVKLALDESADFRPIP